jgi:glycerol-3-phosphate dehydrogenase (NAD(P)+)
VTRRIAVLGAGSWGTALAISLADSGHDVMLWARRPDAAEHMQTHRRNPHYLTDALIPSTVSITSDLEFAASGRDVWVFATPAQTVRELAGRVAPHAAPDLVVVCVAKGIENGTLMTMTRVLDEALPAVPLPRIGVLYGPSHAEEVAEGRPTTLVAAAHSPDVARAIQDDFITPRLRVYVNDDVVGVEIGGSVKNVLALAAGMSDGIGYGDNAKAAIVTRGIAEMARLGLIMGAEPATFAGLTGIGDLVVTCMSRHSRNRYVGEQIGKGRSLGEIQAEMSMVAEGVRTTISVCELARKYGVEMPISEAVYAILFEGKRPQEAVGELMSRSAKREDWLPDVLRA